MTGVIWSTTDLILLAACALVCLLAAGFFIAIFVADARDAKRRAEAKKAFRRARKAFSFDPPTDKPESK